MNGTTLWTEQRYEWNNGFNRRLSLSTEQYSKQNIINRTFWHYSTSSYVEYGSLERPKYGWFGREKMPLRVILYYECSPTHHHLHLLPFTYFIHKWSAGYMAQFLKPSQSFVKSTFWKKSFPREMLLNSFKHLCYDGCIILHIIL